MTQEFMNYTTVDNDRWDLLADKFYGDPEGYERIMDANPHVSRTATKLPVGVRMLIPLKPRPLNQMEGLPPWKR